MRSFSGMVMLHPGDCSPSRKVVSKKKTRSCSCLGLAWLIEASTFRILLTFILRDSPV